jgi:23S rRNA (adenine2503-C2)-methyltransferase
LQLQDGGIIETVGIPLFKYQQKKENYNILVRLTVCISTQVGCPMACDFCATGKGGYKRNLELHEIIDQVLTVQEDFQKRVSNIVFMGMGEPLLNIDNVLRAIYCLNKDIGIGQRNLTLSTVGIPGRIYQLSQYLLQVTLAVSLHAPNQTLRELIIPSASSYPINSLLKDCKKYIELTGRRVSFEYILLGGLNDKDIHAEQLANLMSVFVIQTAKKYILKAYSSTSEFYIFFTVFQ